MPRVSKESAANVQDYGIAEDRNEVLDGYTVNFVTIRSAPCKGSLSTDDAI